MPPVPANRSSTVSDSATERVVADEFGVSDMAVMLAGQADSSDLPRRPRIPRPSDRPPTDPATSARMSRQARRDTAPETALRRELHRRGLRFWVDHTLPGMPRRKADVLFPRARIAVFVDGCFWHACPEHGTSPVTNGDWWAAKLRGNIARDRETDRWLRSQGWLVLRFWEHVSIMDAADVVAATWRSRVGR
jgi:DNA mismatch endonuclease, patch repair protein